MAQDNDNFKIVDYAKYCPTCRHKKEVNSDKELTVCEACHACLNEPARQYSHKPLKYEAK